GCFLAVYRTGGTAHRCLLRDAGRRRKPVCGQLAPGIVRKDNV
ncbi:MAG: hypothetical protein, partial [Olavius algarvensis Delta 4 endosymbiont]